MCVDESKWKSIIENCDKSNKSLCESFENLENMLFLNRLDLIKLSVDYFIKIDLDNMIKFK